MKVIILITFFASFTFTNADVSNIESVAFEGENVELVCKGSDARWLLPNKTEVTNVISTKFQVSRNEEQSKLLITNFHPHDGGQYRCRYNESDILFDLKAFVPLKVSEDTKSKFVNVNGTVSLQCKSSGAPSAVYYWWFGDKRLWHGGNIELSRDTMTLKNVEMSQAGEYTCIVEQSHKTYRNLQERNFRLLVADNNYELPGLSVAMENTNVTLICGHALRDNYTWYLKYEKLEPIDNKVEITTNTITFFNVQPEQANIYTCKNSTLGERIFKFIVEHPPKLKQSGPVTVKGTIGKKTKLECAASAVPVPSYQWFRNGTEIFDNVETYVRVSRIQVDVKSKDDFANYMCVVSNKYGEERLEFIIKQ